MKVENVKVYDLEESVKASKYPMAIDTEGCNSEITERVVSLAQTPKGEGHDQFLTGIRVSFDLTFSNKAWVELERYRFMEFVSSQSTMHRASKFDIAECCNEYVDPSVLRAVQWVQKEYNDNPTDENYLKLVYSLPSGFQLTARLTTNYRELKTIYAQRRLHRLPEWREFCKWIETLPYAQDLIIPKNLIGDAK
jgi:hypothetical protein